MKFKVVNGTNNISIGLSEIGSYFRFNNPLSVIWRDCQGSVGRFFCLLPYSKTYRDELESKLTSSLNEDFSDDIDKLYSLLEPLFSLFKNGDYSLSFTRENLFQYKTSNDNYSELHYAPLELHYTEATDVSKVEEINVYPTNILDYTTYNLYDGWFSFFATQPSQCIDKDRVSYFEKQITSGERPFAIIMQATCDFADLRSAFFIIDGHHKLLAYQNLGIYPAIALITYYSSSPEESEFDAEKLSTLLYPWQIEHILKNWDEKDPYVIEKLKNPDSPLHKFIKNGFVKEYHPNKMRKHQAFYINDKVDGKSLEWYDNGQLKAEHYYDCGKRIGIWKDYYASGRIEFVQPFDDTSSYHGNVTAYYENGQERSKHMLQHGRDVDGLSHQSWFENGDKQAELIYLAGKMFERKNWDDKGKLVNHEIYDDEQGKMIQQPIVAPKPSQNIETYSDYKMSDVDPNDYKKSQFSSTSYNFDWRTAAVISLAIMILLRMCN